MTHVSPAQQDTKVMAPSPLPELNIYLKLYLKKRQGVGNEIFCVLAGSHSYSV